MNAKFPLTNTPLPKCSITRHMPRANLSNARLVGFFLAFFFVFIALFRQFVDWPPVLLFLTGAWFIYGGIVGLFPNYHYRRAYPTSGLAGKNYHVELDENGFSVSGDSCNWRVLWTEVQLKGEDKSVFMFSAKGTIFIFGKKYLTAEQQERIRGLPFSR